MVTFPGVSFTHIKKCKLFNTATMKYLSLSEDGFITTLDEDSDDLKAYFDLHFFHTLDSNRDETFLVVPVHSSKTFLVMTPDKELSTSVKKDHKLESAMVADSSFFYYKCPDSADHVVFEGMNGTNENYYLAVNEKNMKLELQEKKGEIFPRSMRFEIITPSENDV